MMERTGRETANMLMSFAVEDERGELTPEEGAEYDALQVDIAQRLDTLAAARKAAEPINILRAPIRATEGRVTTIELPLADVMRLLAALNGKMTAGEVQEQLDLQTQAAALGGKAGT